jgi:hypothetical protein
VCFVLMAAFHAHPSRKIKTVVSDLAGFDQHILRAPSQVFNAVKLP